MVNVASTYQTEERQLSWDEENRLRAICDNGYVSSYFYDAGGERTVKLHGSGEGIHVNGVFSGGYTNNQNYTLYVNAYMVLEKGGQYTKHIYIGDQRIVSKLGDVGSFGVDPRREEYAGEDVSGTSVPDYKTKYKALQQVIKDNYELFEVDYYAIDNDDYVNGEGFCCDNSSPQLKSIPVDNVDYEKLQYYYHSDHLGSASYITNLDGEVVQHVEYVPFGEVFIEERNNTWNTPFLFNGKELDEETGLYYYGARYYNPRTSLWLSVDPLAEKYPGVSPFAYCVNNPIKYIDPDGRDIWDIDEKGNAKFTDDGKAEIIVNGSPISKFNFTGNEKAYAQIGNHYANYNIGGLDDLLNSSMSVINLKEGNSDRVVGSYNLSSSYDYEKSDNEARMFVIQGDDATINMVLDDGYVPDYYDNKYNFINDIVHERAHVLQNENYGAWGELIAIQKQTLHYSWSKTTRPYRSAIGGYARYNMNQLLHSREYMTNSQWVNHIVKMYNYMYSKGFKEQFKKDYDWQKTIDYHSR